MSSANSPGSVMPSTVQTARDTDCALISIIVNNYNYGRYVGEAIDSALAQTYRNIEVVVVDDGSTDQSRDVIAGYGSRVVGVLKSNAGQGSAFNAGFAASRGDIVIFLDSDDALLPGAAATVAPLFARHPHLVKVQWPLWMTDAGGRRTGGIFPEGALPEGDFREVLMRDGPTQHLSAPTSGNAWRRRFLSDVLPMPEPVFRTAADTYLFELAPFWGSISSLREPHAMYRQHGSNDHTALPLEQRIARQSRLYDAYTAKLADHFFRLGVQVDLEHWKQHSWWHRQLAVLSAIERLPDPQRPIVLVDDAAWHVERIVGRVPLPFLELDGKYSGTPADDGSAISEFERLRKRAESAPSHIVFPWWSFWWLDTYRGFAAHLQQTCRCVTRTDTVVVYELDAPRA